MKKILTWMTLLCMLLSFAALAEEPTIIDPFAEEEEAAEVVVDEGTTEEAQALATPQNYPEGQELFAYDTGSNPDHGVITLGDMNLDVVEARNADQAEGGTVRITARSGQQIIAFRLSFHANVSDLTFEQAFDAKVQVGEDLYACRKYVESQKNGSLDYRDVNGNTAAVLLGSEAPVILPYLVSVEGRTETVHGGSTDNDYILFDVYTLVPEGTLDNGDPVFLILNLGGKQFWYQAM